MSEAKEKYGKGTVKFEKSAPDKTITQELYEALKLQHDQSCGMYKEKSCGHNFYCLCPSEKTIAALSKYEQILNSKNEIHSNHSM